MAYIREPHIPWILEKTIVIAERIMGGKMMPARLLLWSPKAFISSMILEGLVSHKGYGYVNKRMLKLIRMQVSLAIACPFCIDMNSHEFRRFLITENEIRAMQGIVRISAVQSFSSREKLALYYVRNLIQTPIVHHPKLIGRLTKAFSEKEIAMIVTTTGQVAYWTRIIQGFGIQPAGFLSSCDLDFLQTRKV